MNIRDNLYKFIQNLMRAVPAYVLFIQKQT